MFGPHHESENRIAIQDVLILDFIIYLKFHILNLPRHISNWKVLCRFPAAQIYFQWLWPFLRNCASSQQTNEKLRIELLWISFLFLFKVKLKRLARASRTTPPLSGPDNPLGLPLQSGCGIERIKSNILRPEAKSYYAIYPDNTQVLAVEWVRGRLHWWRVTHRPNVKSENYDGGWNCGHFSGRLGHNRCKADAGNQCELSLAENALLPIVDALTYRWCL